MVSQKNTLFYEGGYHLSNPLNYKIIENNKYFEKFIKYNSGNMGEEEYFRICTEMLNSDIVKTNFYKSFESAV